MSFQTFATLEELLEHVKTNAKKIDDKFAIGESIEIADMLEKKTSDHKKSISDKEALEKRARESEAKVKELEPKIAEYTAEIELLKNANPPDAKYNELSERYKKETTIRIELESKNRELGEQMKQLGEVEKQLQDLTARDHRQKILSEIRKIGTELKIPPTVLGNDDLLERWFTPDLKYDDVGGKVWAGKDGDVSVKNYLLAKQKEMPEVLEPRSSGAGAGAGNNTVRPNDFKEAAERYTKDPRGSGINGIMDMIAAAPATNTE